MEKSTDFLSGMRQCMLCHAVGCGTESCSNRIYDFATVEKEGACLSCGRDNPMPPFGKIVDNVVTDAYCELCRGTDDEQRR